MKLEKMEKEKMMLVEEADLATKRAADLEVTVPMFLYGGASHHHSTVLSLLRAR